MATSYLYHLLLLAGWVFIMARGFSSCVAWSLECWLSSCSLRVYVNSCPVACGILVLQPGIEPTSPALEGGFLTTRPPGKWSKSRSVVSDSLRPQWNSPGQNIGVRRLSLLHGIFPTQRSNQGLLHCRWILYQLSHKGSRPSRRSYVFFLLIPYFTIFNR